MVRLLRTREDVWNLLFLILFLFLVAILAFSIETDRRIGLLDLTLLSLSVYRIIRLVVYDKITAFVRDYFAWLGGALWKTVYELITCVWCVGIWASLAMVGMYCLLSEAWILLFVLSISSIASFLQVVTNVVIRYAEKMLAEKDILEAEHLSEKNGNTQR